jgi:hypothetical protein
MRDSLEAWRTLKVILFSLAVLTAVTVLLGFLSPGGRVEVDVEARRANGKIVLLVRHAGGERLSLDPADPGVRGCIIFGGQKVEISEWVFERPWCFAEGDLAWAGVDVEVPAGESVRVQIWFREIGRVFDGTVTVR